MTKSDSLNPYSTNMILKRQSERNLHNQKTNSKSYGSALGQESVDMNAANSNAPSNELVSSFTNFLVEGAFNKDDSRHRHKNQFQKNILNTQPGSENLKKDDLSGIKNPAKGTNLENFALKKQERTEISTIKLSNEDELSSMHSFVLDTPYLGRVAVNVENHESSLKLLLTLKKDTEDDGVGCRVMSKIIKNQLASVFNRNVEVEIVYC